VQVLPTLLTEEPENTPLKEADSVLRVNASTSLDHTACEVIVIKGQAGIGM
jgi:hypothetical protein